MSASLVKNPPAVMIPMTAGANSPPTVAIPIAGAGSGMHPPAPAAAAANAQSVSPHNSPPTAPAAIPEMGPKLKLLNFLRSAFSGRGRATSASSTQAQTAAPLAEKQQRPPQGVAVPGNSPTAIPNTSPSALSPASAALTSPGSGSTQSTPITTSLAVASVSSGAGMGAGAVKPQLNTRQPTVRFNDDVEVVASASFRSSDSGSMVADSIGTPSSTVSVGPGGEGISSLISTIPAYPVSPYRLRQPFPAAQSPSSSTVPPEFPSIRFTTSPDTVGSVGSFSDIRNAPPPPAAATAIGVKEERGFRRENSNASIMSDCSFVDHGAAFGAFISSGISATTETPIPVVTEDEDGENTPTATSTPRGVSTSRPPIAPASAPKGSLLAQSASAAGKKQPGSAHSRYDGTEQYRQAVKSVTATVGYASTIAEALKKGAQESSIMNDDVE